jgi:DNA-binding beta-propeller fold protein YncE
MTGSGFRDINGGTISFPGGTIYPYDVDFDDIGRIYIANYGFSTGQDVVIRLNDITANTYTSLGTGGMNGIKSVAVDRGNKLVYYATNNQLYRCDYNGSNLKNDYTMTDISFIKSIAYHNGFLYIACTYDSNYRIVKYDTTANGQIAGYSLASLHSAWDVIIKNDLCIVADDDESTFYDSIAILESSNLLLLNNYGTGTSVPSLCLDNSGAHAVCCNIK